MRERKIGIRRGAKFIPEYTSSEMFPGHSVLPHRTNVPPGPAVCKILRMRAVR